MYSVYDPNGATHQSMTAHVSGLPAHTMVRVHSGLNVPTPWVMSDPSGNGITLSVAAGGRTSQSTQGADNGLMTYQGDDPEVWFANQGSDLTITVTDTRDSSTSAGDWEFGAFGIELYQPTVSISGGGSVAEDGDPVTMTVSRDTPDGYQGASFGEDKVPEVTVPLTTSGDAENGEDYTLSDTSVTIPASYTEHSKPVTLTPILDDKYGEDTENFDIAITPNANAYELGNAHALGAVQNARLSITLSSATVTVRNDGANGTTKTIVATVKVGSKAKAGIQLKQEINAGLIGAPGVNPEITFSGASDNDGKVTITIKGQSAAGGGAFPAGLGTFHFKIKTDDALIYDEALLDVTVSNQ